MAEQETEKILERYNREVTQHIDILKEDVDGKVELIAEQYESIQEKLEEHDRRFENLELRMNSIEGTLEIMKLDLEFIKNELKQKVNRDEFVALEKRLSILETKFNQGR